MALKFTILFIFLIAALPIWAYFIVHPLAVYGFIVAVVVGWNLRRFS